MLKRIYAAVLLLVFAQVSYAAWDGSVKIPKTVKTGGVEYYEITSPEELIGFLDSVTTKNVGDASLRAYLKNDIVFGSDTSKLCSKRWVRSERNEFFEGDFDGRGHTIYGLNAERSLFQIVGQGGGLVHDFNVANSSFGSDTVYTSAAVVSELQAGLVNVNVINTDVRGGFIAGGVAARMLSSADNRLAYILNCNMIGGSVKGGTYVGGVVGTAYGRVAGCSNSAKVTFVKNEKVGPEYNIFVGGIAGDAEARDGIAIESCVNRGDVEMVSGASLSYAGGIVGYVLGSVTNLQNYGKVSAKTAFTCDTVSSDWKISLYVGGIAGSKHYRNYEESETRDFVNEGDVTAVVETALDEGILAVGGIFGENKNNAFRNALNKGSVKGNGAGKYRKVYAGGVVGYTSIYSNVRGYEKLGNRGSVYAEGLYRVWTGGVVGYMERSNSQFPALSLSYNYGDVTGSVAEDPSEYGVLNVGGILGYAYGLSVSDVYNRGKVIAKGKLNKGSSEVGGLVGFFDYSDRPISNSYSAAPVVKGDTVGGIYGYSGLSYSPINTYYDGSLVDIATAGRFYYDATNSAECKKTTAELQSEKMLVLLNTTGGTVPNRNLWTRRPDGYPVLKFDSLYKNDSAYFDMQQYAMPPSQADGDTLVYTISMAEELAAFLEMPRYFEKYVYKKIRVNLANDIVMGRDTTLLAARQMSADTGYTSCLKADFDGKNHTIYGLNMSRAMFFCMDSGVVVQNLTIANSRFENDWGWSAAAVVVNNGGVVRNVMVRNSLVRGGYSAGGIVASNYYSKSGLVLDSKNENTTVISSNIAGGIAGESEGVLKNVRNSGRVYGRLAGGIVGKAAPYYTFSSGSKLVSDAYNSGTVVASGEGSVAGGGIVGYCQLSTISSVFNTGLVEGSANSATLMVGGVVGVIDSNTTVSETGNWGRVHALNGKKVYAGGVVGRASGYIYTMPGQQIFAVITPVAYSFNYGPVTVKNSLEESYAGGIIGWGKGVIMTTDYNRGNVKNEAKSATAAAGGIVAVMDTLTMSSVYTYNDSLVGKNVGVVAYEAKGRYIFDGVIYGSNLDGIPDRAVLSPDSGSRDTAVESYTFEELKYSSITELTNTFRADNWVDKGCLPVFRYDTTSVCAVNVVKDFFGDADEPYKVGYIVDVFYADSTSNPGGGLTPVLPKPVVSLLQVEVSGRNVTVMGLLENHPVMVFDLRGRMVASARPVGAVATLAVPKAGVYIVRNGNESRRVTIR